MSVRLDRSRSGREWRARPFPLLVLAAAAVVLLWLWLLSGQIRQMQMIFTYVTIAFGALALMIWWAVAGSGSRRVRLAPLLTAVGAALLFVAAFRVKGITGDWLPVVELRFDRRQPKSEPRGATATADVASTANAGTTRASFPRFLGPDGDSVIDGVRLARDWAATPPRLVWQRPIGAGWSGFAIADGRAFTMEQRGDQETVAAYDLATGDEVWSDGYAAYFTNPMAGPGPRATPTVDGERVFTFGSTGILGAYDAASGRQLWQHDVMEEHAAPIPEHGMTGSPLVVDGLVVVSVGGPHGHSLVAYRAGTGELAWSGGDDIAAYASPVLVTLADRRQILAFNRASVASHDPADGSVIWTHPWPKQWPNVATPVVIGEDRVMFSTGYGVGSKLLRIRDEGGALRAELEWETPRLKSKFANLAIHDGFVYGLDDGVLTCLDPADGSRRWKAGRYGHGNLLIVGDLLLVQSERGEMVLIEPTPEEHRELARFMALRGKAWNPFALAGDQLLVRNDAEAALWQLPLES
jgi:outer membrane protein assembly factor BamB